MPEEIEYVPCDEDGYVIDYDDDRPITRHDGGIIDPESARRLRQLARELRAAERSRPRSGLYHRTLGVTGYDPDLSRDAD